MKIIHLLILLTFWVNQIQAKEAKFYRDKTEGIRMANGQRFYQDEMTCASNKYKLGTILKVTYNGRESTVKVTERTTSKTDINLTNKAFKELAPTYYGKLRGVKIEQVKTNKKK